VRRLGGFTLIEALIVIFLIAFISAIAVPNIMKWRVEAKLRGAAENLKGDLELAKLKAIQANGPVAINFTESGYTVFRDNGATLGVYDTGEDFFGNRSFPPGIKIVISQTTFTDDGFGGKRTRFMGRGTADAGTAFLLNTKGTIKKIIISPVGRITVK